MTNIDLRSFSNRPYATRLGDIVYMPEAAPPHAFVGAQEVLLERLDRLPTDLADIIRGQSHPLLIRTAVMIAASNEAFPFRSAAPAWFAELPEPYRRDAEREWANHSIEDSNVVLGFRFARLGGYVVDFDDTGLLGGAYDLFRLYRLGGVRQLGWLTQPLLQQDMPNMYPMRFEHHRLIHVWDVAALANLLGHGLNLPTEDMRTLTLAAATHDARTPAGGDTTKLLDRDFFDEDAHYGELLVGDKMTAFLGRFGIDPARPIDTVHGKGLLGSLLDLADKTAYLCRDAFWFHMRLEEEILDCEEGVAIHGMLKDSPAPCDAWRSAELRNGQLVLTDVEALARMLKLRALLFRALYWHPGARFTEFIVSHLVLRHLFETGEITREKLLEWNDQELDKRIEKYTLQKFGVSFGEPVYEGFDTLAAAEACRDELHAAGERYVMIETLPPRIKSGTHFRVIDPRGESRPLVEAYPELAAPVDALARVINPFRLYWVPWDTLPEHLRRILKNR